MDTTKLFDQEITSSYEKPVGYYNKLEDVEFLQNLCKLKDRNTALYDKRWQSAKEVIDRIARRIEIDPDTSGYFLYAICADESPLVTKLDDYFDRSGDKVKLKRRIDELERENSVLRSLVVSK